MIYSLVILNDQGAIQETISFDAVTRFSKSYSMSVAQNPVEEGFSVSDHISRGNTKFSMSAVVTDSLFMRKGATLQYVNGKFQRLYEDVDPITDESPSKAMQERLEAIAEKGEIFGLFESKSALDTNVVNLIYPCALTSLDFENSDGSEAVYPVMSFEKIRVARVETRVVENPSPQLIPYVKSSNAGNQTGSDGIAGITDVKIDDTDLIKQAKEGNKDLVQKVVPEEKSWADAKVAQQQKQIDEMKFTNQAEREFRKRLESGKLTWSDKGEFNKVYVNSLMTKKYGAGWQTPSGSPQAPVTSTAGGGGSWNQKK
ncbi:structural protein [Acinetobacter phage vB_AbaM_D22]|nr:structural protein [Acinetobacter phage vB_AbaM_D22]